MPIAAPEIVQSLIGHIAGGLRPEDAVSRHYTRLMADFGRHAITRWLTTSQAGIGCQLLTVRDHMRHACPHPAAGACIACGHLVCVHHALADAQSGDLLCKGCVQKTVMRQQQPGPGGPTPAAGAPSAVDPAEQAERIAALDALGLPASASLSDVKRRFKELSKQYHPDTFHGLPEQEKEAREKRYREITRAYHFLIERTEQAA